MIPSNPFPVSDKSIKEELFVGRDNVLSEFELFLTTQSCTGKNSFWVISGDRGQGKTSLFDELIRKALANDKACCAFWNCSQRTNNVETLEYGIYYSVFSQKKGTNPLKEYSRLASQLLHNTSWFGFSFNFFSLKLPNYSNFFKHPMDVVQALAKNLKDTIETLVFVIDEVSFSDSSLQSAKDFAKCISDNKIIIKNKQINILTIVFVKKNHSNFFTPKNGGPRSGRMFELTDFTVQEIESLVNTGFELANNTEQGTVSLITLDTTKITNLIYRLVGGMPTLTLGLLYDAYNLMEDRATHLDDKDFYFTDEFVIDAADICTNQLHERLALFRDVVIHGDNVKIETIRQLATAISNDSFDCGPWLKEDFVQKCQGIIGKAIKLTDVITPFIAALTNNGIIYFKDNKLFFRGEVLKKQLASCNFQLEQK